MIHVFHNILHESHLNRSIWCGRGVLLYQVVEGEHPQREHELRPTKGSNSTPHGTQKDSDKKPLNPLSKMDVSDENRYSVKSMAMT